MGIFSKTKGGVEIASPIESLQAKLREGETKLEMAKSALASAAHAAHTGTGNETDVQSARAKVQAAELRVEELRLAIAQERQNETQRMKDATLEEFDRRVGEFKRNARDAMAAAKSVDKALADLERAFNLLLKARKAAAMASPVTLSAYPNGQWVYVAPAPFAGLLELALMKMGLIKARAFFDARAVKSFAETLTMTDVQIEEQLFKPVREQKAQGQ